MKKAILYLCCILLAIQSIANTCTILPRSVLKKKLHLAWLMRTLPKDTIVTDDGLHFWVMDTFEVSIQNTHHNNTRGMNLHIPWRLLKWWNIAKQMTTSLSISLLLLHHATDEQE